MDAGLSLFWAQIMWPYFRVVLSSVINPMLSDLTPRYSPDILSDEQNVLPSER